MNEWCGFKHCAIHEPHVHTQASINRLKELETPDSVNLNLLTIYAICSNIFLAAWMVSSDNKFGLALGTFGFLAMSFWEKHRRK